MKRLLLLLSLSWAISTVTRAQLVALKTNALMDAALVPNLEVEVATGNKTSISLSAFGSIWVMGQDVKTLGALPEFRYWIGGRPMVHLYMGVGAMATTYNINWKHKNFKGDAVGLGLEFGYDKPLNKHWNMEVSAGTQLALYYQHMYYDGDSYDPKTHHKDNHGFKLLPYRIGLSFTYIIK